MKICSIKKEKKTTFASFNKQRTLLTLSNAQAGRYNFIVFNKCITTQKCAFPKIYVQSSKKDNT